MKTERYFEWLDGDKRGEVSVLDYIFEEDGDTYYVFKDGETCNEKFISPMCNSVGELKSKSKSGNKFVPRFMVEIDSIDNVWTYEPIKNRSIDLGTGQHAIAPSLEDLMKLGNQREGDVESSEGKLVLVAPKRYIDIVDDLPKIEEWRRVEKVEEKPIDEKKKEVPAEPVVAPVKTEVAKETEPIKSIKEEVIPSDPVSILVSTAKKSEVDMDITLTMMLPSKALFKIAESNFELGGEKFVDKIIDGLDVTEIINSIRESLMEAYKSEPSQDGIGLIEMPSYSEPDQIYNSKQ